MQNASVISSIQTNQASRSAAPAIVATTKQKVTETVNLETADQATQIMKKYDLHSMDYHEIGRISRELHDAGIVTGLQKVMMTAPPIGSYLKLVNGQTVIDNSDAKVIFSTKIDFLKSMELRLAAAERDGDVKSIHVLGNIVNTLHNLDTLNA